MALLESLNPNFLSEDKFKFLQEKLKERIAEDECDIAFKRRPLPEGGRYDKYGNIWMSGSVSPTTLPHISNIIEEYCANANGLNDADALKTIGQLDMAMHLGGFVILKPIIKK